ncbi:MULTISPECIES: hypothetical protein [unclassified Coleofasciculus]|uniref:hypothetical protein n=1 Tax=unclassified Coleofasciculus TaxID=2692782 RepID=UPI00187FCCA1|nr:MULTISPECIES: hypothetical protein [unclassified Coleofasciculus]MBE9130114.1 hypothetical protein [Coleofasciculus sp. LEGE 07081]MBE9152455.1 hypothetical protein [Coleofasciculus sp. LEGE 07092]
MPKASVLKLSPKWGSTKGIIHQKSRGTSRVDYLTPTPVLPKASVVLEANQKNKLWQKTSSQISLAPIFKRLKELAQLEADWDSYGAEPVSSVAIVTAFELLDALREQLSRKVRELLPQFIAPLVDGGLQLEWSGQQGELEVEIDPNGDLGYVLIEGQGTNRKFKEQHQVSLNEVLNLLSQFLSLEIKE